MTVNWCLVGTIRSLIACIAPAHPVKSWVSGCGCPVMGCGQNTRMEFGHGDGHWT